MERLRLLILAEQNNPDWMSGPLLGYLQSYALAQKHDVTVVTHRRNLDALIRAKPPFREIVAIDAGRVDLFYSWMLKRVLRGDHGSQLLTAMRIPYYIFYERLVWARLSSRLRNGEFDAVLRLTPVSPVLPSYLARPLKKLGVPFIVGPVNGGLPRPAQVGQPWKERAAYRLRSVFRWVPFVERTYADASAVIAGSSWTYKELRFCGPRLFFLPENGISTTLLKPKAPVAPEGPLRIVFIGRLIDLKRCDLAIIGSAGLMRQGRAHLTIVGQGPEMARLRAIAGEMGVTEHVKFTGVLSHAQTMEILAASDVFVFPSIRDFGGGVVFEALACGVPPIVVDYGGPADIVTPAVGVKLPLAAADVIARGIAETLTKFDRDRTMLMRMSAEAQTYAADCLTWEVKSDFLTSLIYWAMGRRSAPASAIPGWR